MKPFLFLVLVCSTTAFATGKPNILIINCVGQGCVNGGKEVLTPHLDKPAANSIRVPFVLSWPRKLPTGITHSQPVITLYALASAGQPKPADKTYDDAIIIPHLAGDVLTPPLDRPLRRMHGKQPFAILEGNLEFVRTGDAAPEFYDLTTTLTQKNNLAAIQVETATRLTATLDRWSKELHDPVFPGKV